MNKNIGAMLRPIEAIESYLDQVGEFTDQEIVVEGLIEAGFAPRDPKREWGIRRAILYHATRSKRLVIKDGKVGKAEWAIRIQ